jgi:hypothetical protein
MRPGFVVSGRGVTGSGQPGADASSQLVTVLTWRVPQPAGCELESEPAVAVEQRAQVGVPRAVADLSVTAVGRGPRVSGDLADSVGDLMSGEPD